MSEEESKALTTGQQTTEVSPFAGTGDTFALAQRQAQALAQSDIVPTAYKGKVANCLVAMDIAQRMRASPLVVMQNLHIVHGKPGWAAQFIIAQINTCGRFGKLGFTYSTDGQSCHAHALELSTNEEVRGPVVTIEMSKKEGWYQKSGSKWQTMPELMLSYRAATFFGRLYCPEVLFGMQSIDEVRDVGPQDSQADAVKERNRRMRGEA